MAQKDAYHHPSPVRSFILPEISESVEETKVDMEPMEKTSFEEMMAPKDLQSQSSRGFQCPSHVRFFASPQTSRGTINQTLQSVELHLGCLLRRYIRHVQMKQLRKTLDENFKETRNLKDRLEFKKVHSQLCKFDCFRQSVKNIWDIEQASADETRRLCIARTAHLFQQVSDCDAWPTFDRHSKHAEACIIASAYCDTSAVQLSVSSSKTANRTQQSQFHLQIHPKALHGIKLTRNVPGSSLKISRVQCLRPV
ncbi:protein FAM186A-like isoform X1 [Labeo rohita]|uniref:Protein FAM186A-like isoform X1 n=1 Tax=Labeo rohita TaxID=84645 RepID=A0A498L9M6_LABRO|nr:protein FAM186A-like isoform X1 [Labeo rohita]